MREMLSMLNDFLFVVLFLMWLAIGVCACVFCGEVILRALMASMDGRSERGKCYRSC